MTLFKCNRPKWSSTSANVHIVTLTSLTFIHCFVSTMAPSLRVSVGSSVEDLHLARVNDEKNPAIISNENFEGRITIRIQNFTGIRPSVEDPASGPEGTSALRSKYFDHNYAKNLTWSIQVQGRFKKPVSGDALVFGNQFEKPIRDRLPWGTSVALKAINILDPNLRHDVYCDQPWAFGPLLTSVSRINIQHNDNHNEQSISHDFYDSWPTFPSGDNEDDYVHEDTSALLCKRESEKNRILSSVEEEGLADMSTLSQLRDAHTGHTNRAKFWANQTVRQAVEITPQDIVTFDFCPAVPIDFNTLKVVLPYTGGMGFDLQSYWDGQPVRYYCKNDLDDTIFFIVE